MYSQQQISDIKELAASFVTIREIAIEIEVDYLQLKEDIADESTEVSKAYKKGKNSTLIALKRQEAKLALMGSPLGIAAVKDYLIDMNENED